VSGQVLSGRTGRQIEELKPELEGAIDVGLAGNDVFAHRDVRAVECLDAHGEIALVLEGELLKIADGVDRDIRALILVRSRNPREKGRSACSTSSTNVTPP
jgi:hypothetical protein